MNRKSSMLLPAATLATIAVFAGCAAIADSMWENVFGYAKRQLLVEDVETARESQAEAKQQFQSTFDAFKALTGFDGGELEQAYKSLKKEYDRSADAASEVSKHIDEVDRTASNLFEEWTEEIEKISSPKLRGQSEKLKADTERDYGQMIAAMRAAENRMKPVLTAFNDNVLFLKHNLNAKAIGGLKSEVLEIEKRVQGLIDDMQKSITEANSFIESMKDEKAE